MTPSSRRNLGLAFIIAPPVCLFGSMILGTIFALVFSMGLTSSGGGGLLIVARVINLILGLLGIVGVVGFFTLLPIGLYLFFSTPKTDAPTPPPAAPKA